MGIILQGLSLQHFIARQNSLIRGSVLLMMFLSMQSQALPDTCIQDPQRTLQCPRLIYKNASLPDPQTGQNKNQLVCICLTDFQDLLLEEEDEVDRKIKQMRINDWTAQLGISEEKLRELIKY